MAYSFNQADEIFSSLYAGIDGYSISEQDREKLSYWYIGHTYGEILFPSFAEILAKAEPKSGDVFYDLGSGVGKATIAASLLYDFSRVVGIEKMIRLYNQANIILGEYNKITKTNQQTKYINDDFKSVDFSDADMVFMHATCWSYELENLNFIRKLEGLKKGARIITATYAIGSTVFNTSHIGAYKFNWGKTNVYLSVRI